MTHDDAMAFICQHDKDGDGELSINEFLDAMMSASVPILDANGKVIGQAPAAPRPELLPKSGKGMANVEPTRWSISKEQWLAFIDMCKVRSRRHGYSRRPLIWTAATFPPVPTPPALVPCNIEETRRLLIHR